MDLQVKQRNKSNIFPLMICNGYFLDNKELLHYSTGSILLAEMYGTPRYGLKFATILLTKKIDQVEKYFSVTFPLHANIKFTH